ncbi:hypothetical protein BD410DRAFT_835822 [Rickenella mellea]|uniref:Uncharacterized protein n=1 Tax=Rickenella mellea TaxID=50990 RepID=A0A4Y7QIW4_9AGAM|nr:hypothetical protein BD410DRAFT_835822 [Rickenella mellea]
MSTAVPPNFDPFATHPFTNSSGVMPRAPQPHPYPKPVPQSTYHNNAPAMAPSTSIPTPHTPLSVHAPQPLRASPGSQSTKKPVFEPFKLDRSSPDLKDVLAKKPGSGQPGQKKARS